MAVYIIIMYIHNHSVAYVCIIMCIMHILIIIFHDTQYVLGMYSFCKLKPIIYYVYYAELQPCAYFLKIYVIMWVYVL